MLKQFLSLISLQFAYSFVNLTKIIGIEKYAILATEKNNKQTKNIKP